ncbi:DUF4089 domain-containing protein [Novosphingobium flavum]|uniref:DUF4089 domain-containing protein n=1 Tax=Novosphingobium flavum TaxID=1778672 RepID=A0A7X1FSD0_9SPHN|nr:DUF4089 domain-containing protein [Novosphingobium flavum]MBC2666110.1 DUF4089 domain-containing protein [Novosphingobium flavum]
MPLTEEQVRQLAALSGLEIAPGHLPGVIRNLEVLQQQIALLFADPVDPVIEPAAVYRP